MVNIYYISLSFSQLKTLFFQFVKYNFPQQFFKLYKQFYLALSKNLRMFMHRWRFRIETKTNELVLKRGAISGRLLEIHNYVLCVILSCKLKSGD